MNRRLKEIWKFWFQVRRNLHHHRWFREAALRRVRRNTRPMTRAVTFVLSAIALTPHTTTWCGTWGTSADYLRASPATCADASSGARTISNAILLASTVCSMSLSTVSSPMINLWDNLESMQKETGSLYSVDFFPHIFFLLGFIKNFVFLIWNILTAFTQWVDPVLLIIDVLDFITMKFPPNVFLFVLKSSLAACSPSFLLPSVYVGWH